MQQTWLLYVSKNKIPPDAMEAEIADIVATSCIRNEARGITGALIASPLHIAQYMEGPADAVDRLIARIGGDDRHRDVRVIARGGCAERMFPHWSMAYAGSSTYVRRALSRLAEHPETAKAEVEQVLVLMREFARPLA